jgi:hypothetical protein
MLRQSDRALLLSLSITAGIVIGVGTAQANVTFEFVTASAQGGDPTYPHHFGGITGLQLTVTDAAYASGSLVLSKHGCGTTPSGECRSTGNLDGFVSLFGWDGVNDLDVNVTFSGQELFGSLAVHSGSYTYDMSSTGTTWFGTLSSSQDPTTYGECHLVSRGQLSYPCTFTGAFRNQRFAPARSGSEGSPETR